MAIHAHKICKHFNELILLNWDDFNGILHYCEPDVHGACIVRASIIWYLFNRWNEFNVRSKYISIPSPWISITFAPSSDWNSFLLLFVIQWCRIIIARYEIEIYGDIIRFSIYIVFFLSIFIHWYVFHSFNWIVLKMIISKMSTDGFGWKMVLLAHTFDLNSNTVSLLW